MAFSVNCIASQINTIESSKFESVEFYDEVEEKFEFNEPNELECFEFAIMLYHGTIRRPGKTLDDALELAEWGYNQCMDDYPG